MAELLIQWTNPTLARFAAEPSLRRRGDIRAIGPNGHTWGRNEDMRRFITDNGTAEGFPNDYRIVQVPYSVPAMRKMVRQWKRAATIGDKEFIPLDARDPRAPNFSGEVVEHQHAWRINIRELPAPKRIELAQSGFVSLNRRQFRNAVVHKALLRSFDEKDSDGLGAVRDAGAVD